MALPGSVRTAVSPPRGAGRLVAAARKQPLLLVCVTFLLLLTVWAPLRLPLPHDPSFADNRSTMLPPSGKHLFGTDQYGYDIFSRSILAAYNDLTTAAAGTLAAAAIGTVLGVLLSHANVVTELAMRVVDLAQSLPLLAIAITIVGLTGGGRLMLLAVIIGVITPIFIRLVRAESVLQRRRGFVLVARSYGASEARIVLRHLVPNASTVIFPQLSLSLGMAIIMISGLGFLGLHAPGTASWGGMLQSGISLLLTGQWWVAVFPSIMIFLVVLTTSEASVAVQRLIERPTAQGGQW